LSRRRVILLGWHVVQFIASVLASPPYPLSNLGHFGKSQVILIGEGEGF
jgi:hypothetical protein